MSKYTSDLFIFAGLAVFFAGVWRIYPPAALVLGGGFLAFVGVQVSKLRGKA